VRHLAYLLLVGWLTWLYAVNENFWLALVYAIAGMLAFVLVSLPLPRLSTLIRTAGSAPAFYTFLVAVIGLFFLHVELEHGWQFVTLALVTLGAAVLAIALQGRNNGAVRYLGYTVFAVELLYLASVTVGSILGTSSLFLFSGLFVAAVAWIVIRLERRFAIRTPEASL